MMMYDRSDVENSQAGINSLRAKFFNININLYLQFISFLYTDMTQVLEILLHVRQEPH